MELHTYLPDLNCSDFNEILLDEIENLIIDLLCSKLFNISSICKRLKQDSTSVFHVCALIDTVIDHQPATANRLRCNATIVENAVFENAIVILQGRQLHDLNANKLQILKWFQVQKNVLNQGDSTISLSNETLHKFNMTRIYAENSIDTWFIVSKTNKEECWFSTYRHAVTDNQSQLSPTNLEEQLFYFSNRRLWGISDIYDLIT